MRTRTLGILLAALSLCPLAARADDTKPPVISDVKASQKGGKVSIEAKITDETGVLSAVCSHRKMGSSKFEDTAMVKNDYDDTFKVSFTGGADTEYYLQSTDLLGNGPALSGSASKPLSLGGKPTAVAAAEPPHAAEPPPAPRPEPAQPTAAEDHPHHAAHHKDAKEDAAAPTIQHRKPNVAQVEGQDAVLRVHISAPAGLKAAMLFLRPQGYTGNPAYTQKYPLANAGGESFTGTIPASDAHGTVEYVLMAEDNNNAKTTLGDPDPVHWFSISFKAADSAPALVISSNSPAKWAPGQPIHLRAQATLPAGSAELSDQEAADLDTKIATATAKLLYRTQDAGDQAMDMTADPSGGAGGFMADLPAQPDGNPVYYQVVICLADKCAIDTGSKHKWNAFTATGGDAVAPAPLSGVSSKGPAGLPE